MNIHTVAQNLRNTIAGKELHLAKLCEPSTQKMEDGPRVAVETLKIFLEININELKVILFDVEKCCEKATLDSWTINPDRSGGAFTDEEINRGSGWQ